MVIRTMLAGALLLGAVSASLPGVFSDARGDEVARSDGARHVSRATGAAWMTLGVHAEAGAGAVPHSTLVSRSGAGSRLVSPGLAVEAVALGPESPDEAMCALAISLAYAPPGTRVTHHLELVADDLRDSHAGAALVQHAAAFDAAQRHARMAEPTGESVRPGWSMTPELSRASRAILATCAVLGWGP